MSGGLIIEGGWILDPASGQEKTGIVETEGRSQGGRIVLIGPVGGPECGEAGERIDARGLWVCPGFVDLHVHLRDPGDTDEEDLDSGARAAAAGGFTTLVCMPNTRPVLDDPERVEEIRRRSELIPWAHILPCASLTLGSLGMTPSDHEGLHCKGAVAFSDDGRCPQDASVMEACMRSARAWGPILQHAEDVSLSASGSLHEGRVSRQLNVKGIPSEAESRMVRRDLALAAKTGARLHIQHVSCAESMDLIREAKKAGIPVTCEVTPHHIALTEESCLNRDPVYKVNPPLRTEQDRQALLKGIVDRTVDCLATDHAPHRVEEKIGEMERAAFGMIGMESAFQVALTHLVDTGLISPLRLVELMSTSPAALLRRQEGLLSAGRPADIVLVDPDEEGIIDPVSWRSKSKNCPFIGMRVKGRVVMTIVSGQVVFRAGRFREE